MNLEIGDRARRTRLDSFQGIFGATIDKHRLRLRFYVAMVVLDCLSIVAALMFGNLVHSGSVFDDPGVTICAVVLPMYFGFAYNGRVYCADFFKRWRGTVERAIVSLGMAVIAVVFVSFLLHASATMSREVFIIGTATTAMLLYATRAMMHRLSPFLLKGEPLAEYLICDEVELHPGLSAVSIDAKAAGLVADNNDPAALDRLGRLFRYADRVVIACPENRRADWAAVLKGANVRGEVVVPEIGALGSLGVGQFSGRSTLVVSVGPLDMRNRAIKRLLDMAIAGSALLALAPLLVMTAIAIRLESAGPIFFVQSRLGRGNRLFAMYKFRSMRSDMCDANGAQSTLRDDVRITRVGKFIRATSIDELPQIFNVLKGDMSIVGPRPHALGSLAGDQLFWEVDQRYWHRHAIKPGITGLAQVRGFRGATHLRSDLVDRLQADLDYLNGWTIWRDLQILVATLKVVLHKNAY
jgi:exopolysaccharide biosynthesis polyprenyl glycosylphosphotransferase